LLTCPGVAHNLPRVDSTDSARFGTVRDLDADEAAEMAYRESIAAAAAFDDLDEDEAVQRLAQQLLAQPDILSTAVDAARLAVRAWRERGHAELHPALLTGLRTLWAARRGDWDRVQTLMAQCGTDSETLYTVAVAWLRGYERHATGARMLHAGSSAVSCYDPVTGEQVPAERMDPASAWSAELIIEWCQHDLTAFHAVWARLQPDDADRYLHTLLSTVVLTMNASPRGWAVDPQLHAQATAAARAGS
jgi:hypothetical protein